MEFGLILICWYGVLHAFAPDHLSAIINFSIGKSKRKTFLITISFAIGHGVMLFIFAKLLQSIDISHELMAYGDVLSSLVILTMGIYILYMVLANKIYLHKHIHNNKEHIHISFSRIHKHKQIDTKSAFAIGALMGIGGVRGMLITLGLINNSLDISMVFMFVFGVSLVFIVFGVFINYINTNILNKEQNIKKVFGTIGVISLLVGTNMLIG